MATEQQSRAGDGSNSSPGRRPLPKHGLPLAIAVACLALAVPDAPAQYSGPVRAEWASDGRTMTLLEDFSYTDRKKRTWTAPKGMTLDGASIPRWAWPIIGGPFEGRYRDASVIHDAGCMLKWAPWPDVHEVFYWGMLDSGVEEWRAKIMYVAVYQFADRWSYTTEVLMSAIEQDAALDRALRGAPVGSTAQIVSAEPTKTGPVFAGTTVRYRIEVTPAEPTMTREEFDALRADIERKGMAGEPTPSLQDLRGDTIEGVEERPIFLP